MNLRRSNLNILSSLLWRWSSSILVITTIIITTTTLIPVTESKISMPKWFSKHLVLQTNVDYGARSFLNGKAVPGEIVSVNVVLPRRVATLTTIADLRNGHWLIQLNPAFYYSGAKFFTVTVTGSISNNTVTASNVTFGDVFLCSGQSNMVYPLKLAFNATKEAETLQQYPNFRFFVTSRATSDHPQWDFPSHGECDVDRPHRRSSSRSSSRISNCNRWITQQEVLQKNGKFILDFSAVCYLTIRDLMSKLQEQQHQQPMNGSTKLISQRPIGLVQMAWSGTRVEAWMSKESIKKTPYASVVPHRTTHNNATVLYNAMVHPWNHYAVRGVLWYQGESNANQKIVGIDQTNYYSTMYQAMIADWRKRKGMGDFAWGTVQLPPSVASSSSLWLSNPTRDSPTKTGRPEIRLAQAETSPHKNGKTDISSVAVTIDLGGVGAWGADHPPNKNEISRRLALGLLHSAYAAQNPLWTGPILDDIRTMTTTTTTTTTATTATTATLMEKVNSKSNHKDVVVVLTFSRMTSLGMELHDVKAFNINGTSNSCRKCCAMAPPFEVLRRRQQPTHPIPPGDVETTGEWWTVPRHDISIDGNKLILRVNETVSAVRYAWADYVDCVLVNSDNLVASPFLQHIHKSTTKDYYAITMSPRRHSTETISKIAASNTTEMMRPVSSIQSPPMGFNSWNFHHCNIDENTIKAIADAMVSSGMAKAGYRYVNIDDCWQVQRLSNGVIQEDPARFPSGLKDLADYVHSRGLLFGLYTASHSLTCQKRPGSYRHEELDAQTYCDWGIDYLKIDECYGHNWDRTNTSWIKFRKEFDACQARTGRPVVLSVSPCRSVDGCGQWIGKTVNLWRTTDDIESTWESVLSNIHAQEQMYPLAKPGNFNDPDMLQIGNVGLSLSEQHSHMALWCISGAPLLVGTDLVRPSNNTLSILTNPEVTAVNQDLGWKKNQVQGRIIKKAEDQSSEVWAKRLMDGSWSVVLLNLLDDKSTSVVVRWVDLGLSHAAAAVVRDLWLRKDVGSFTQEYRALDLRPHSSEFLRIIPHHQVELIS